MESIYCNPSQGRRSTPSRACCSKSPSQICPAMKTCIHLRTCRFSTPCASAPLFFFFTFSFICPTISSPLFYKFRWEAGLQENTWVLTQFPFTTTLGRTELTSNLTSPRAIHSTRPPRKFAFDQCFSILVVVLYFVLFCLLLIGVFLWLVLHPSDLRERPCLVRVLVVFGFACLHGYCGLE